MSRSKKWRLEWAFFLGENGRRQYNKLCKGCVHPCKQSFRAVVVSCPHYLSLRSKKVRELGLGMGGFFACGGFSKSRPYDYLPLRYEGAKRYF